jgi:glucokinase
VPYSSRRIVYDPQARTAIGISRLGTSKAVAIGACAFALARLG